MSQRENYGYDWMNPIDGELTVIVDKNAQEGTEYMLDLKYGYHTYAGDWKRGTNMAENAIASIPAYLREKVVTDTAGNVWIPFHSQVPGVMIYLAKGQNDSFEWICQAAIPVSTENDIKEGLPTIQTPVMTEDGVQYIIQEPGKIYKKAPAEEFEEVYSEFMAVYNSFYSIENSEEE